MILIVYLINNIIRLVCGFCLFYSFNSGYYLLASFFLLGVLKRNWLIYNVYSGRNKIQISVDPNYLIKKTK